MTTIPATTTPSTAPPSEPRRPRLSAPVLAALAALVVVVIGACAFGLVWSLGRDAPAGIADIGGPFALVDQDGGPITDRTLLGKPTAVFFGYTHCPEACPTTLMDMTDRLQALGPDADRFNVLMISLDPARDTPALLKAYLGSFDPHIRAATGTPRQVADVAKEYRVYWRKVGEGEGYTLDHSTAVYLMDAKGVFVGLIDYQAPRAEAVAKMRQALAS